METAALQTALQTQASQLEADVWTLYVNMRCPNPRLHELTGVCHDCENKFSEMTMLTVMLIMTITIAACRMIVTMLMVQCFVIMM